MGFRASPVKDDMATLAEFFVPWFDIVRIAAYFRLARKQFECIIKLLEVFIALPLSPFFGGKAANINKIFAGSSGKQVWTH